MSNLHATQPELEAGFPKHVRLWTCPLTGMSVPKDPVANLQWRSELLAAAENDAELQIDLYTACKQSVLFFVNAFCFTLRIFDADADGIAKQAEHAHLPFVTWPIQDKHIVRLEHCIEVGESLLTDKSRDMGATWDHIVVYIHRFLFAADESHLLMSRKEECVDLLDGQPKNYPHGSLSNPGTLFGKIDYVLSRLPEWMLPRMMRKSMHLVNLENRTRIDGESSNATAGSSDRRTSIFLDEMAKMKEAESIKRSTKDVTACRLPCSTPNGAGTSYSKWRLSGRIPVMQLPWWEHPEKGFNRYSKQDDLGRWRIRSPWYDKRCEEDSPKEIAIELDMDHVGSGDTFFESTIIEQHKKLFAREPKRLMSIRFRKGTADDNIPDVLRKWDLKQVETRGVGKWKVWCELPKGRLDQTKTYIISIDISKGQGASNSTMNITCCETREKVMAYADANTPPHELARLACAAALWCGGRNKRPLIIWENNGDPGFDFGEQLCRNYQYPNVYFAKQVGTMREKVGKRWGWRSSPENKAAALGLLRRSYAHGRFINHDEKSLDEALTYIHYENGGIGPAELVEESESNRKSHGDRVIADMLGLVGMKDAPRYKKTEPSTNTRSIGGRFKEFQRNKKAAALGRSFNFGQV